MPSTVFVVRETPYQLHDLNALLASYVLLLLLLFLLGFFCLFVFVSPSYIENWDLMPLA